MKKRFAMRVVTVLAVFILLSTLTHRKLDVFAAGPQAATGKATDKAADSRGAGEDPNVKDAIKQTPRNDAASEAPAPPSKGGAKTRGIFDCWITANNYTPWWIDVYVDGTYRGQVAPWGQGTVNAGAGGTTVYGRAEFVDGRIKSWGPRQFVCSSDGSFTWRLDR